MFEWWVMNFYVLQLPLLQKRCGKSNHGLYHRCHEFQVLQVRLLCEAFRKGSTHAWSQGGALGGRFSQEGSSTICGNALEASWSASGSTSEFFWGGNPMQIQEKRRTFPEVSHGLYESQLKSEILRVLWWVGRWAKFFYPWFPADFPLNPINTYLVVHPISSHGS